MSDFRIYSTNQDATDTITRVLQHFEISHVGPVKIKGDEIPSYFSLTSLDNPVEQFTLLESLVSYISRQLDKVFDFIFDEDLRGYVIEENT
ncbi:hypothetical protein [uncultured Microscilla sp.]|uniref:hypothetical protein n=1 Tax=uncultured Microscilla sp. TaxID=432653 RepID=UPI00262E63AA|nr:hypothetical protein [uncultured Microscilla sp.]